MSTWRAGVLAAAVVLAVGLPDLDRAVAGEVVLEGFRFGTGPLTYAAPRIVVRDPALPDAELRRLFDPTAAISAVERVRTLEAAEITVPELRAEALAAGHRQTTVYRDLVLRSVAGGRAASIEAAGGTIEGDGPGGTSEGGFGPVQLRNIDLRLALSVLTESAGAVSPPLRPVYGALAIEGLWTRDGHGATMRIVRIAGRDLVARPLKAGWGEAVERLGRGADAASPAMRTGVFDTLIDMVGSADAGALEAVDLTFEAGQTGATPASGRIARIGYRGGDGRPSAWSLDGLDVTATGTRVQLGAVSVEGVSAGAILAGLREFAAADPGALGPGDVRRLVPPVGVVRVEGLAVTNGASADRSAASSRFGVGQIEIGAANPVEGLPTDLRLSVAHLDVPTRGSDLAPLRRLAELGFERLDASFVADLAWDASGEQLAVRDLSVSGEGLGQVAARGLLGQVSRDLFGTDPTLAAIALVGTTAQAAEVTIEDRGLAERLVAQQAERRGLSRDDVRREYGLTAALGIPASLGGSPAAVAIGQAVARFVAKPGRLRLSARAKSGTGVPLTDFAAGLPAPALLDRFEIGALAE